jgi:hypothetical protein
MTSLGLRGLLPVAPSSVASHRCYFTLPVPSLLSTFVRSLLFFIAIPCVGQSKTARSRHSRLTLGGAPNTMTNATTNRRCRVVVSTTAATSSGCEVAEKRTKCTMDKNEFDDTCEFLVFLVSLFFYCRRSSMISQYIILL